MCLLISAHAELNIRMRSSSGVLQLPDIPHVWISNKFDSFDRSLNKEFGEQNKLKSVVPWYTPSWQLKPGFHLDGETGFVTRRFVASTIFHDVILQREPVG